MATSPQASPSLDQARSQAEERAVLPEQSIVEFSTQASFLSGSILLRLILIINLEDCFS